MSIGLPIDVVDQDAKFKPPHLRFEESSETDNEASIKAGRKIVKPCIKVFIRAPGDEKSEVPYVVQRTAKDARTGKDVKVYPWFDQMKERLHHGKIVRAYFDHCQKAWEQWEKDHTTLVEGTPISEWQLISKAECENLKSLGVLSVENAADMTEEAMGAYGMGGRAIKSKANEWLKANTAPGQAAEKVLALESQLQSQSEKNEDLVNQLSAYDAKLQALEALVEAQTKHAQSAPVQEQNIVVTNEPNYENWDIPQLVEACKGIGLRMANPNWTRETLIRKLQEA